MRRIPTRKPIGTLAKASDETTNAIVPTVGPLASSTRSARAIVATATLLVARTGASTRRAAADADLQRWITIATTAARSTTPIAADRSETADASSGWCETRRTLRGELLSPARSSDDAISDRNTWIPMVSAYPTATIARAARDSSLPRG